MTEHLSAYLSLTLNRVFIHLHTWGLFVITLAWTQSFSTRQTQEHLVQSLHKNTCPADYSLLGCWRLACLRMKAGCWWGTIINLSISVQLHTISLPVWIQLALQSSPDDLCSLVTVIVHSSKYISSGLLCCISVNLYSAVVGPLHLHWEFCCLDSHYHAWPDGGTASFLVELLAWWVHSHDIGVCKPDPGFRSFYLHNGLLFAADHAVALTTGQKSGIAVTFTSFDLSGLCALTDCKTAHGHTEVQDL